ncbi:MAG: hypothetical protein WCA20_10910 [Candidatus Sulfotelmatobacter sp.]
MFTKISVEVVRRTNRRCDLTILSISIIIYHPDISRRVIATDGADLSAVTEPEIEALAKRHMIAAV